MEKNDTCFWQFQRFYIEDNRTAEYSQKRIQIDPFMSVFCNICYSHTSNRGEYNPHVIEALYALSVNFLLLYRNIKCYFVESFPFFANIWKLLYEERVGNMSNETQLNIIDVKMLSHESKK